jgi:hypothetical protein
MIGRRPASMEKPCKSWLRQNSQTFSLLCGFRALDNRVPYLAMNGILWLPLRPSFPSSKPRRYKTSALRVDGRQTRSNSVPRFLGSSVPRFLGSSVPRFLPVCPRSDRKGAVHRFGYLHRLEMLFGGYFVSEYTASLSRNSPESTGPCSTFVELPPRTLRNCEKYAGRPHALKSSGPSIND